MGFVEDTVPGSHITFRHNASDTLILLAPHDAMELARPIDVKFDVKYLRRVLDEKGLLNKNEFDRRVAEAYSLHTA